MSLSRLESLKIKAKLLQKAKRKSGQEIPLKQAFEIIARSAGFGSWREMKEILEETEHFNPAHWSAQWKLWFASYEEALRELDKQPGTYLLPYQKHFFLCDENYLSSFGLKPDHADLMKVGRNWVEPKDPEAWQRLLKIIKKGSS